MSILAATASRSMIGVAVALETANAGCLWGGACGSRGMRKMLGTDTLELLCTKHQTQLRGNLADTVKRMALQEETVVAAAVARRYSWSPTRYVYGATADHGGMRLNRKGD